MGDPAYSAKLTATFAKQQVDTIAPVNSCAKKPGRDAQAKKSQSPTSTDAAAQLGARSGAPNEMR